MINFNFEDLGNYRYLSEKTFNPHTFDRLTEQYPSPSKFEDFDGANRRNNQREHKKKFLSFNSKIKENLFETSAVNSEWEGFIDYFKSEDYINKVKNLLNIDNFDIGFEWSIMENGSDLCPHSDCCKKLASHVFFFPHLCWRGDGGDFVFLDGNDNDQNPEIDEFENKLTIKYKDNSSILFKNSKDYRNWHTVTKVKSNIARRVFQIIFWAKGEVNCYQA